MEGSKEWDNAGVLNSEKRFATESTEKERESTEKRVFIRSHTTAWERTYFLCVLFSSSVLSVAKILSLRVLWLIFSLFSAMSILNQEAE